MKTFAATLILLTACGTDDGPLPASEDPRTVPCSTFRTVGYGQKSPTARCYFDVGDLDTAEGPFTPEPPATTTVYTIGGYCGPNCSIGGGGAQFVDGTTWRTSAMVWVSDLEYGTAVVVGEFDDDTCIWKRCERVE